MLYMIIETFKNEDPGPVYRRFEEKGRMAPPGLTYLSSWVDSELKQCFQLMDSETPGLIDQWMSNWSDIIDFEVIPVMPSGEAAKKVFRNPE